jgi:hypothetical protein
MDARARRIRSAFERTTSSPMGLVCTRCPVTNGYPRVDHFSSETFFLKPSKNRLLHRKPPVAVPHTSPNTIRVSIGVGLYTSPGRNVS